ncbi:TBC1 domain family member 2A [Fragariocoptes setiger]|uniref:TBC1 domain family member 2A n=1 Tax=Fragariocoptes setiger TaxID=1670756 RepID=A0ABQ7SBV6_9ACAR|nr:TBC1 domain family member 2A [Fragariocoptes setiger]
MYSGGRKFSLNIISSNNSASNNSIPDLVGNNEAHTRDNHNPAGFPHRKLTAHTIRDDSGDGTELNASQQVISLLQRQLEQLRLEKSSLERVVIRQVSSPSNIAPEQIDAPLVDRSTTSPKTIMEEAQVEKNESNISYHEKDSSARTCNCESKLLQVIQTQIYDKDEEILKLKKLLRESDNKCEQMASQVKDLESTVEKLQTCNGVLTEMLELRDQTVVTLTNELFESEASTSGKRRQSIATTTSTGSMSVSRLKSQFKLSNNDTHGAHKKEKELVEEKLKKLADDCKQAEKRELDLRSQNTELEAKYCQLQSKLLSLLKEIEQSSKQLHEDGDNCEPFQKDSIRSESVKILIRRLLEDSSLNIPLSWKEGNRERRRFSTSDASSMVDRTSKFACDELGFYVNSSMNSPRSGITSSHEDTNVLETISETAETDSHDADKSDQSPSMHSDITSNYVIIDSPRSSRGDTSKAKLRWDEFVKNFDKTDLSKSKEFKSLLRLGVPLEYRCKVWRALVNLRIAHLRESEYGPNYYQHLLNLPTSSNKIDPTAKQIELDLLRTLPNNFHFKSLSSSGTMRLKRVLTAYSRHNPSIGYCQGMNRIAAVALLSLPEEEAFWCLVAIIEYIMPQGYYSDLWLAQIDSFVVSEFISIKMPGLHQHLEKYGIELSLFAWFLTIFVDGISPEIYLRCWDCFLYEGDKILFRLALALIKIHEGRIMRMTNSATVNSFLRSLVDQKIDVNYLFEVAFNWTNPLSSKSLRQKRETLFSSVKNDLDSMEKHRAAKNEERQRQHKQPAQQTSVDHTYDDNNLINI